MHPSGPLVLERALAILLGLFLFTMLFRGGNMVEVITASVYLALPAVAIAVIGYRGTARRQRLSQAELYLLAGLAGILLIGAIGLLPVNASVWLTLPGHHLYAPVVDTLRSAPFGLDSLALTLDPMATRRAVMVATVCLGIAFATSQVSRHMVQRIIGCLAALAVLESLIGLVQLGFGGAFIFDYVGHTRAAGTFVNKNHFATLLAMSLPVLLMRASGQFTFFGDDRESGGLSKTWWGLGCAVVLLALVASGSRAGVFAALVSSTICCWLILRRKRAPMRPALLAAGALLVLTLALAWYVGAGRLFASISPTTLGDGVSSRAAINADTWNGILAFFPLGAGLGSYGVAFQRFQSERVVGFVEYAHNDYLQLLFEGGIAGVVVFVLFGMAAFQGVAVTRRQHDAQARLGPGIACLLGVFAFAVHAAFDFPAHIPALAFIATLLSAVACNPAMVAPGAKKRLWTPPEGPSTVQLLSSADNDNLFAPTTIGAVTTTYRPGSLDGDAASPEKSRERYPPPPARAWSD